MILVELVFFGLMLVMEDEVELEGERAGFWLESELQLLLDLNSLPKFGGSEWVKSVTGEMRDSSPVSAAAIGGDRSIEMISAKGAGASSIFASPVLGGSSFLLNGFSSQTMSP